MYPLPLNRRNRNIIRNQYVTFFIIISIFLYICIIRSALKTEVLERTVARCGGGPLHCGGPLHGSGPLHGPEVSVDPGDIVGGGPGREQQNQAHTGHYEGVVEVV